MKGWPSSVWFLMMDTPLCVMNLCYKKNKRRECGVTLPGMVVTVTAGQGDVRVGDCELAPE